MVKPSRAMHSEDQDRIDPDLFDSLVQVMSVIGTFSGVAIAWLQLRQDKNSRVLIQNRFQFKQQVSNLDNQFSSVFRIMRDIISLFKSVEVRDNKSLSDTKIGFGRATYNFTSEEFGYYQTLMIQFNGAISGASHQSLALLQGLKNTKVSGEDSITDNLEDIHENLNKILFESKNFDDAIQKLNIARDRIQAYIRQLENLGNGP